MKNRILGVCFLFPLTTAFAQTTSGQEPATPANADTPVAETPMTDTLQIGGKLEWKGTGTVRESEPWGSKSLLQSKKAELYFDARPNPQVRTFVRAKLAEQNSKFDLNLDELWIKTDWNDSVFMTFGKQKIKWGSSRLWNPTDFLASQSKDPFALRDERLGLDAAKFHFPIESKDANLYAVAQFDSGRSADEIAGALRAEWAFLGIGELATTIYARPRGEWRAGLDLSVGLNAFDLHWESAFIRSPSQLLYAGDTDISQGQIPSPRKLNNVTKIQTSAGLEFSFKYSDEDSLFLGGEYFYNQLGSETGIAANLAVLNGDAKPLQGGRSYVGAFARLPAPGSWNETQFYASGIHGFADISTVAQITAVTLFYKAVTFELFANRCFGGPGELCFALPKELVPALTSPVLPDELKQRLSLVPLNKPKFTAGLGLSASF